MCRWILIEICGVKTCKYICWCWYVILSEQRPHILVTLNYPGLVCIVWSDRKCCWSLTYKTWQVSAFLQFLRQTKHKGTKTIMIYVMCNAICSLVQVRINTIIIHYLQSDLLVTLLTFWRDNARPRSDLTTITWLLHFNEQPWTNRLCDLPFILTWNVNQDI